jgi:hypothetical protein
MQALFRNLSATYNYFNHWQTTKKWWIDFTKYDHQKLRKEFVNYLYWKSKFGKGMIEFSCAIVIRIVVIESWAWKQLIDDTLVTSL